MFSKTHCAHFAGLLREYGNVKESRHMRSCYHHGPRRIMGRLASGALGIRWSWVISATRYRRSITQGFAAPPVVVSQSSDMPPPPPLSSAELLRVWRGAFALIGTRKFHTAGLVRVWGPEQHHGSSMIVGSPKPGPGLVGVRSGTLGGTAKQRRTSLAS